VRPFLEEIGLAYESGFYSTALMSALVVPDACGAVEYPNLGNNKRYISWYDKYVASLYTCPRPKYGGELMWKIRNGMIHETSLDFCAFDLHSVIFTIPETGVSMDFGSSTALDDDGKVAKQLGLDLRAFTSRIVTGAQAWLKEIEPIAEKQARLHRLIQLRLGGMPPLVGGIPVIA
jgi:hypothetical protein